MTFTILVHLPSNWKRGIEFFYRAVCAKAAVYCKDQVLMGKIAFKGVFTRVHPYRAKTLQT